MMQDRDFILRMVREFATFLSRIVRAKDETPVRRTIADLDDLSRHFIGLGLEALEALPADQLTLMLGIGGALDVNRAYAAGRVLEERAAMAADAGDEAAAATADVKALHLLLEAAHAFGGYLNDAHREAIVRITDRRLGVRGTGEGPGSDAADVPSPASAPAASADAGLPPDLLSGVLDVHLREDEPERVRRIAEALAAAQAGTAPGSAADPAAGPAADPAARLEDGSAPPAPDPMTAVRIALRGRNSALLGRVAEVLDGGLVPHD